MTALNDGLTGVNIRVARSISLSIINTSTPFLSETSVSRSTERRRPRRKYVSGKREDIDDGKEDEVMKTTTTVTTITVRTRSRVEPTGVFGGPEGSPWRHVRTTGGPTTTTRETPTRRPGVVQRTFHQVVDRRSIRVHSDRGVGSGVLCSSFYFIILKILWSCLVIRFTSGTRLRLMFGNFGQD